MLFWENFNIKKVLIFFKNMKITNHNIVIIKVPIFFYINDLYPSSQLLAHITKHPV